MKILDSVRATATLQEASGVCKNSKSKVKDALKEAEGMLGEKHQSEGVFQTMVSRNHMPLSMLSSLGNDPGSADVYLYRALMKYALRPALSTIESSELYAYGASIDDIPPNLKERYEKAKTVWEAKELQMGLNCLPSEIRLWGLVFNRKQFNEAIVNPEKIDEEAYVPEEVLERMRDLGLFSLKIPQKYGGLGLSHKEYDKVLRGLAHISGTLAAIVSAHSTIGSAPLMLYGNEMQKEKYLTEIAKGNYLCAFALTEPTSGTDAIGKMKSTSKKSEDGKHYILNGEKVYITNTHRAGLMYVMAKTEIEGKLKPTAFIVELPFRITDTKEETERKRKELEKEGLYISKPLPMMNIRGSNQAYIEFHDFKVPVENVLGNLGKGTEVAFNSLNKGRAAFGTFCAESAKVIFEEALKHTVKRKMFDIFGGRQADLPYVKGKLSEMAVKVEALNAASELITNLIDKHGDEMNIIAEAACIKALASDENWNITQIAMDLFGGLGTMRGIGIDRAFRDAWIPKIVEGVNPAMRQHLLGVSATPANRDFKSLLKGNASSLWKLGSGFLKWEKGNLEIRDALWIQLHTHLLSLKCELLGALNGDKTILKQHELIQYANEAMGLFTVAACLIKLRNEGMLSEKEKRALLQYVYNVKRGIEEYPDEIADLYIKDVKQTTDT